jgi:hypothetical protein
MRLSRDEVMVLKSLRHPELGPAALRHLDDVIASLVDQGLVIRGQQPAMLTPEGAELAAQLERRWPE